MSSILSLPSEVVENCLISCADHVGSVSAFAQTCRQFRTLVYDSLDQHLWRELHLIVFDDPRPAIECTKIVRPEDSSEYNWKVNFINRTKAARFLRRYTSLPQDVPDTANNINVFSSSGNSFTLLATLRTIWSVLSTADPLYTNVAFHLDSVSTPIASHSHIIFPPLVLLAGKLPASQEFTSCNSHWVESLLVRGYPPELSRKLLSDPGELCVEEDSYFLQEREQFRSIMDWDWWSEEASLFYKLVCCTGFIPMFPPSLSPKLREEANSSTCWSPLSSVSLGSDEDIASPFSPSRQYALARRFARVVVYNLRYPSSDRAWGPFLPGTHGENHHLGAQQGRTIFADNNDSDEDDDEHDLIPLITGEQEDIRFDSDAVRSQPLFADYRFLACARIVVEENLKAVMRLDDGDRQQSLTNAISALKCLQNTRIGSSPDFWKGWNAGVDKHIEREKARAAGNLGEGEDWSVNGWDWAGVEGEWKRCVCWLDYRDLLVHNLHSIHSRFGDPTLQEVVRIVPMSLHIESYSEPSHPDGPRLPTIHVKGEMSDRHSDDTNVRIVSGTVSMTQDGSVRWSLTSGYVQNGEPEWITEGVQIGSIGSAMGVLGMWTGAQHARTDPIGPFWAWKVASAAPTTS